MGKTHKTIVRTLLLVVPQTNHNTPIATRWDYICQKNVDMHGDSEVDVAIYGGIRIL